MKPHELDFLIRAAAISNEAKAAVDLESRRLRLAIVKNYDLQFEALSQATRRGNSRAVQASKAFLSTDPLFIAARAAGLDRPRGRHVPRKRSPAGSTRRKATGPSSER